MLRATTAAATQSVFRPEIEGLRAVAATLVAVFHIWLGRVSGGVDVFFVVSSFLITTGLVSQIERTGHIRLAQFWSRLIKRLLPVALSVLTAVVIASVVVLPKSRWKDTIEAVAASAAYVENWLLAYESVDYLAQHDAVSPVQHFWALSVQGQFYLVWPLLFTLGACVARRTHASFRAVMVWTLAAIFMASFAYSIFLTSTNQPFAYFNTFTRAWEFCIGALLAILISRIQLPKTARVLAGWTGVAAILSCGIILRVSTVFPGYAALWPTLAAALVIIAGTTGSRLGVDRLLASRPMVALGGMSYSLYLVHFPILVFVRTTLEPGSVDAFSGTIILAASVAVAMVTNRLIENPTRYSSAAKDNSARSMLLGGVYVIPVVIGLIGWTGYYFQVRSHERTRPVVGAHEYPGAEAMEGGLHDVSAPATPVYPGPFAVDYDREDASGSGCNLPDAATEPAVCTVHAPTRTGVTVAVVGGSHSAQWLPGLLDIAAADDWRLLTFTKSNCPFYFGESVGEKQIGSCHEWNENVLKLLLRLRPDVVFTTSTRSQDTGDAVPEGYARAWKKLSLAGIQVVAIRDNPDFGFDVSACIELHGAQSPQCTRRRAEMLSVPNPVLAYENRMPMVRFLDLSDYFCDRTTCYPEIGNVLIYRHMNHITATYVHSLAPMLERAMWSALKMPDEGHLALSVRRTHS